MMAQILNTFLTLNLLIIVGYLLNFLFPEQASTRLKLQYSLVPLIFILATTLPLIPRDDFSNSTIRIWAQPSKISSETNSLELPSSEIRLSTQNSLPISGESFSLLSLGIFSLIFGLGVFRLLKEALFLRNIHQRSFTFKKYGKVTLLLSDEVQVPFSYWRPGTYYSVFPTALLQDSADFKVAFYHELQHHRQGDTKWVYPLLILKAFGYLNPLTHLLCQDIQETQELACDEVILKSQKVSTTQYIGCLLRVAQTVSDGFDPVCAAGFCFNKRHILKRRIQMMNMQHRKIAPWALTLTVLVMTSALSFTAYATRGLVQDRRISLEEAQQMASRASENSQFPVVVNSEVLSQLNRYLGTSEGRSYMKSALKHKKEFDGILSATNAEFGTPLELNAIPVAESGYKNLPSRFSNRAAGIWMFIPATARTFGMKVTKTQDERLDVKKETVAAHRYLLANKNRFDDWLLAIMAYNVGERALEKGIKEHQTRDVWELSKFVKTDKDYMAKVMASVIIMKNTETLE
jgi:membrane-bound lytic murein transglycosylase D